MTLRLCVGTAAIVGLALLLPADGPRPPRTPWTSSKIVGSPDPAPPYRLKRVFENIPFKNPVLMAHQPHLGRAFVAEQAGPITSFAPALGDAAVPSVFFDPKKLMQLDTVPKADGFESVYGLAFHPRFPEVRECFVCYTLRGKGVKNLEDGSRVSRFKVTTADPPTVEYATEEVLLTFLQGGHNGGDLHFGPDGMLYISTGDAADPTPPDPFRTGQDVTDLLSSVLRIDVDRRDPGRAYRVPPDNPFVGTTSRGRPARGEVWAYGFRNPWRMSFDRQTGDLWVGDVGWELWETVHRVKRGQNAGWSRVEGPQAVNPDEEPGPTPVTPPAVSIPHSAGASVTGGFVYRGRALPELAGQYVFGDWMTRRVWAAKVTPAGTLEDMTELVKPSARVIAFGEDADGELTVLDYDGGGLYKLERSSSAGHDGSKFPRTLTATGLFTDVAGQVAAPGVTRYDVVAPRWHDGATAARFAAVPTSEPIRDYPDKRPVPGQVSWQGYRYHFPAGTVFAKTIAFGGKRVETQILHFDGEDFHPYSYAWRDDQADADLVPAEGGERWLTLADPLHKDGTRRHRHALASRAQCLQCHNGWAETVLGFQPPQLAVGEQLRQFYESGLIEPRGRDDRPLPLEQVLKPQNPPLVNPADAEKPLESRVKGYLHANCAHCHRHGGGGAVNFELTLSADLTGPKLTGPPSRGGFDLTEPRVIAPGHPGRSALLYRMTKFGGGRMPHLGAELPDPLGLTLLHDWMATGDATADPSPVSQALVAACRYPRLPPAERATTLEAMAKLAPGPARELFEGYLTQPGEHLLGPAPNAAKVLAIAGDAARGEAIFRRPALQCLTCHRLGDDGRAVGPDLAAVAPKRSREQLLESLLDPSKVVEPAYQAHVVTCADGRVLTGTVTRPGDGAVVVRSADGTETRLAPADIDALTPSPVSLMPSGLLSTLTHDEAADLLAFLQSSPAPGVKRTR